MQVTTKCPICKKFHKVEVDKERYMQWRRGEAFIQDALHDVSEADREMLMSGMCPACWDKFMKEEE